MKRRMRQYLGILAAVVIYYVVHEGAHLICALWYGVFKQVNFMGVGIQIDVYNTRMTDFQMGVLCLMGAVATFVAGWLMVCATKHICRTNSPVICTIGWYSTLCLMLIDPLYLTVLHFFVGGGDMNGISLLIPKPFAIALWTVVGVLNLCAIIKCVYPQYVRFFSNRSSQ